MKAETVWNLRGWPVRFHQQSMVTRWCVSLQTLLISSGGYGHEVLREFTFVTVTTPHSMMYAPATLFSNHTLYLFVLSGTFCTNVYFCHIFEYFVLRYLCIVLAKHIVSVNFPSCKLPRIPIPLSVVMWFRRIHRSLSKSYFDELVWQSWCFAGLLLNIL